MNTHHPITTTALPRIIQLLRDTGQLSDSLLPSRIRSAEQDVLSKQFMCQSDSSTIYPLRLDVLNSFLFPCSASRYNLLKTCLDPQKESEYMRRRLERKLDQMLQTGEIQARWCIS